MATEKSKTARSGSTKSTGRASSAKGQRKKQVSQPLPQTSAATLVIQEPIQDIFVDGFAGPVEMYDILGRISTIRFNLWSNHATESRAINPVAVGRVVMDVDKFVAFMLMLNGYYTKLRDRDETVKKVEEETLKSLKEAAARAETAKK